MKFIQEILSHCGRISVVLENTDKNYIGLPITLDSGQWSFIEVSLEEIQIWKDLRSLNVDEYNQMTKALTFLKKLSPLRFTASFEKNNNSFIEIEIGKITEYWDKQKSLTTFLLGY